MTLDLLFLATLVGATLRASTPLLFAALGGLVSELAGSINIALEGMMLIAAFFGVIASAFAPHWLPGAPGLYPWIGCAAGLTAAIALAGLLAVFHLELGADLILAGIGINILAQGLTMFLLMAITGDKGSTAGLASFAMPRLHMPLVDAVPVLGVLVNGDGLAGQNILVYGAFAAAGLVRFLLYRTAFGLHLRAVGESSDAALSAGISVRKMRYAGLLSSGLLAGFGGIFLAMGYLTLFQTDMVAGRGFLALAAVFLGARRPAGILAAALLFGASQVFAAQLGLYAVPSQVVFMVPPLVTIAALVLFSLRRRRAERRRVEAGVATIFAHSRIIE